MQAIKFTKTYQDQNDLADALIGIDYYEAALILFANQEITASDLEIIRDRALRELVRNQEQEARDNRSAAGRPWK